MDKKIIIVGMTLGSWLGSYLPTLFGASGFSFISLFGGLVGGIVGIWLTFKFLQ